MAEAQQQQQKQPVKKAKGKVVDKWKAKSWYSVIAPEFFNSKEIGQIVSSDEENLVGRKVNANLGELTGSFNMSNAYTTIKFLVKEVKGKHCYTEFIGHELAPAYVRTLARRRRSVIMVVKDNVTKDGKKYRIKMTVVTGVKVSAKAKTAIRKAIEEELASSVPKTDYIAMAQDVLFGKLSQKVYLRIKKIAPIRKIEAHKSEIVVSVKEKKLAAAGAKAVAAPAEAKAEEKASS
ncbi:MAG TPA: hypothetical protein PLO51_00135 [Candidatus Micrarchaeota archaeon]|nr:hypothetical protein [Candidatus Micrarchaeota archaeon]